MKKGLVHLYCGDGKGKTTAAMGLCLRAVGSGKKVVIAQFLKSTPSGEIDMFAKLGVKILRGAKAKKFVFQMAEDEKKECAISQNEILTKAMSEECDVLLLDEVCSAFNLKMLEETTLKRAVLEKEQSKEIIMTGRDPAQWITDAADYITNMQCVRHPYTSGVAAREGIEF